MDTKGANDERVIVGYGNLAKFLTDKGYEIAKTTVHRLCSLGKGPPEHGRWGKRKVFWPSEALVWARCRPSDITNGHPPNRKKIKSCTSATTKIADENYPVPPF